MKQLPDFKVWARRVRDRPMWIRVVVAVGVAGFLAATFLVRARNITGSDLAFKIALGVAMIVAMVIVAPQLFSGRNVDPNDWTEETDEIRKRGIRESRDARDL